MQASTGNVGGWMQAAASPVVEAEPVTPIATQTNPFARDSYYAATQAVTELTQGNVLQGTVTTVVPRDASPATALRLLSGGERAARVVAQAATLNMDGEILDGAKIMI
jgi:hypothetical protein